MLRYFPIAISVLVAFNQPKYNKQINANYCIREKSNSARVGMPTDLPMFLLDVPYLTPAHAMTGQQTTHRRNFSIILSYFN